MKFLCENCKAKYQLSDDRLEGRAVHMKCRKCGHIIEVPSPSPAKPAVQKPSGPAKEPAMPPRPASVSARAPTPPGAGGGVRLTPLAARSAAAASRLAAGGASTAAAAPATAPSTESRGLAAAFSRSVKDEGDASVSAAIEVLSAGATEEWYVGINDVPVGPVRLSTLRQKALQGVVTESSLVWREGFDEWLPLRTFPELTLLVQEARDQARSGLTPSAPQAQRPSSGPLPPPPGRVVLRPPSARVDVMLPQVGAATSARTASDSMSTGTHAAADSVGSGSRPPGEIIADPYAAPVSRVVSPSSQAVAAALVGAGVPDSVAINERISSLPDSISRPSLIDEVAFGIRRQVRVHPAAWAMVAFAGLFGATAAIVWLGGSRAPAPPPTIQIVTVNAPAPVVPGAGPSPSGGVALSENTVVGETTRRGPGGGQPGSKGGSGDPKEATSSSGLNVGLGELPGLAGPGPAPKPGGADMSNLPQLDQAEIQRVVSSNIGTVKRHCWEPALASRSPNAPMTARVSVVVTIGADGSVQNANASGASGYPDLPSCISGRVRNWKFPPSSGTSTVNIPFVFAAQ